MLMWHLLLGLLGICWAGPCPALRVNSQCRLHRPQPGGGWYKEQRPRSQEFLLLFH